MEGGREKWILECSLCTLREVEEKGRKYPGSGVCAFRMGGLACWLQDKAKKPAVNPEGLNGGSCVRERKMLEGMWL